MICVCTCSPVKVGNDDSVPDVLIIGTTFYVEVEDDTTVRPVPKVIIAVYGSGPWHQTRAL